MMTRILVLLLLLLMTGCGADEPNTESKSSGEQPATPGEQSKPTATKPIPTVTHKTVAGTGKMEGWAVYEPMVMVER
ncbi:MAG: hypothetical protein VB862_16655, partial [Pirellulaceae bacterium]